MKLTPEQTRLCIEALRARGTELVKWAARDGDDLRVRGEAMHELAASMDGEAAARWSHLRRILRGRHAAAQLDHERTKATDTGMAMVGLQCVLDLMAELEAKS